MKTIRNVYFIAIAAISLLISGCDANKNSQNSDSFTITVRVSECSHNYARVTVQHNGPEDICWYGFLTSDVNSDEFSLFVDTADLDIKAHYS